jgi:hypothetical protein
LFPFEDYKTLNRPEILPKLRKKNTKIQRKKNIKPEINQEIQKTNGK